MQIKGMIGGCILLKVAALSLCNPYLYGSAPMCLDLDRFQPAPTLASEHTNHGQGTGGNGTCC